ncbi:isochorismatase family protein [Aestuariirhabdus litorea]|uniref:Isochorismatase family protein n=1 Tax=Aestuariirhabdus litorea TaxID=2528527 RepID=A0A3P3VK04_9GAMM|nr:isochorismatase family protein [Aestuariirhabdus litorea]RRJ83065.1 isochorismatase family protein [Aestuariirhabdus litorea]RWW93223.1 isochorismatase family protein [Endozoicomonadaceae bacterium GTF-13]
MLQRNDTALLFIDVQGNLATRVARPEALFQRLEQLLRGSLILRLPVIWMEQNPKGLGGTLPRFVELLEGRSPLAKQSFSGWAEPEIRSAIEASGASQLLLCGIEAHVCVYQTARDLLAAGYAVHLVTDAVSSRDPANSQIAIERLVCEGARLTSVEMALFELVGRADDPCFRQLLRVIK